MKFGKHGAVGKCVNMILCSALVDMYVCALRVKT